MALYVCSHSRANRSSIASLRVSDWCKMMLRVEWLSESPMYWSQSGRGYLFLTLQKASGGLTSIQMSRMVIIIMNTICCCSYIHLLKYITQKTKQAVNPLCVELWILHEIRFIVKEIHKLGLMRKFVSSCFKRNMMDSRNVLRADYIQVKQAFCVSDWTFYYTYNLEQQCLYSYKEL